MSGRIAIVAPRGRDAAVIAAILGSGGLEAFATSIHELLDGVATNAFDAAILVQDALAGVSLATIREAVNRQPAWSDFPFVLLTSGDADTVRLHISGALGNVTQVERPVRAATLLNCAQSALRARVRQHQMRSMLEQQRKAELEISTFAQNLEQRVSERTAELNESHVRLEREMRERADAEAKLRQLQATLIHVSRLSAANTMASTIAHELNQPLAAAVNYLRGAHRLLHASGAPSEAVDAVDAAARNVHRAGDIIRHLRGLVSNAPMARNSESLRAMIEDAKSLVLLGRIAEGVVCTTTIDDGADVVFVDRIQVGQVFVNVLRNAVEAMDGRPQREIRIVAAPSGKQVRVSVSDTGPGFGGVPSDLSQSSFVSTKANGLGIGLSICRTIIEANGGAFEIANGAAGGAEVSFTLPVVRGGGTA